MRNKTWERMTLSLAHWAGLAAVVTAGLLFLVHWRLSIIALSVYVLCCVIAPFLPRIGFFVPVISRGCSGLKAVALTFDDGPDPLATTALLRLLSARRVAVTFFVTGCKVPKYPALIEAIIDQGHTIGNHSYHHDPLVFFKGSSAVRREITSTQQALLRFGIVPRVYRPPVGIVGPGLREPLQAAGLQVVNFSCRAFDRGNKKIVGMADRILKRVQADDIILLHDIMPKGEAYCRIWLKEIEKLLSGLERKGLSVLPLQVLIGKPVMDPIENDSGIRSNSR
jgi:peptidoglycan/xylan/chitin deacetylase (PgdA/CDA1 family)